MTPAHAPEISGQYATFLIGGHHIGVPVLDVQEVLRAQRLTRVPLANEVVEGLINLRGQIVPALDMRRLLGLAAREAGAEPLSVVVHAASGPVSLQVDEIGDVLELDAGTFEIPPRNLDASIRALLEGVRKLKDRLLLVLEIRRTVEVGGAA
jgi:purine-binding chemotaxis protein CheW